MKIRIRKKIDIYVFIMTFLLGAWLLVVMISPYLVPSGQLTDLSGAVLRMENGEKIDGINPIAWLMYSAGDVNCHQLQERSFFLNDNQMPFCARDIGVFIGGFAGSLAALIFFLVLKWQYVVIAVSPLIIDSVIQELTEYESTNEIRLITGIIAGAAALIFICQYIAMPSVEENERNAEMIEAK